MKMQVREQSIRLRLSEADLATLLADGQCSDSTALPGALWKRTLRLLDTDAGISRDGDEWCFSVPRLAFQAFASQRPRRDGYVTIIADGTARAIELSIEVDVRDSRKHALTDRKAITAAQLT